MEEKERAKKQILLRISPKLWKDLAVWAEDDFRSINGQIEFLLSECVRQRKKHGGFQGEIPEETVDIFEDYLREEDDDRSTI
ncbi:MAG: Arc family DNA-binding protein [Actinobacteria bacterium]|nr:Arc family DNA-binding protein [Actinomycetota bacterium]